jgi:hypothetical protein
MSARAETLELYSARPNPANDTNEACVRLPQRLGGPAVVKQRYCRRCLWKIWNKTAMKKEILYNVKKICLCSKPAVFWDALPCSLVEVRLFSEVLPASKIRDPDDGRATSQNTVIFINAAVRT